MIRASKREDGTAPGAGEGHPQAFPLPAEILFSGPSSGDGERAKTHRSGNIEMGLRGILALVLLLVGGGAAWAAGAGEVGRFDLRGIIVYQQVASDERRSVIAAVVRAGTDLEPRGQEGLASVVAALLRSHLEARLPAEAGMEMSIRHRISPYCVTFILDTPSHLEAAALSILSEGLMSPEIDAVRFEPFRDQLQVLRRVEEGEELQVAQRLLEARLLGEHPGSRLPTSDSLGHLTLEQVVEFHKSYYSRNNTWLAVSSAEIGPSLEKRLLSAFQSWPRVSIAFPPKPPEPIAELGWERIPSADAGRAVVMAGGLLGGRWSPARWPARILLAILSERLDTQGGAAIHPGDPSVWRAWLVGRDANQADLLRELKRLARYGVYDREFTQVRSEMVRQVRAGGGAGGDDVVRYAESEAMGYPGDQWKKDLKRLSRLRSRDVHRVASQLFAEARLSGVVLEPAVHGMGSSSDGEKDK